MSSLTNIVRHPALAEVGDPRVKLLLALARALHRYGTPAHRLEETLHRLADHLGVDARFFSAPTALMASFGDAGEQRTELVRLDPGSVDLAKLARVEGILSAVESGAIEPVLATRRLQAVADSPAPYGRAVTIVAYAAASGTAARFFAGGAYEILVASLAGAAVGALAVASERSPTLARLFEPIAAFVATLLALAAAGLAPLSPQIPAVAALIVLVPGLTMTVAMMELANRHLISGTTRLVGAAMVLVQLVFGAALASRIAGWATVTALPVPLPAWTEALALLIAPVALTIVMRARFRDVGWIALSAALGFSAARLGAIWLGPDLGAFPAAITVMIFANVYRRVVGRSAMVPLMPGLLLLVPGSLGFRSVAALVERDVVSGLDMAVGVVMVAASIVAGLLLGNAIVPPRRVG